MSLKKLLFLIALLAIAIFTAAVIWNHFQTPPLVETQENSNSQTAQISNAKPEKPLEKKLERNSKLQAQTDSLLYLFDKIPSVPIYLKDEPIIKNGTNVEHGVAYTDCGKNKSPTIYIKKVFYEKANQKQLTNILKHELTHAWQCKKSIMSGHDAEFRKKFTEVGGFGN
jgi:SprT-like family